MHFSCLLFKHHMSASVRSSRNWWWFYLYCNFLMNWYLGIKMNPFQLDFKSIPMFSIENSRLNWVKAVNSLKGVFSSHFSVYTAQSWSFHSANDFPCLDLDERWKIQSILKWILMGDETIRWKENKRLWQRVFTSFEQSNRSSFSLIIILSAFLARKLSVRKERQTKGGSTKSFLIKYSMSFL